MAIITHSNIAACEPVDNFTTTTTKINTQNGTDKICIIIWGFIRLALNWWTATNNKTTIKNQTVQKNISTMLHKGLSRMSEKFLTFNQLSLFHIIFKTQTDISDNILITSSVATERAPGRILHELMQHNGSKAKWRWLILNLINHCMKN